ncbi:NADH-quinone oxidoreductase subunit M [Buchnera aphidicola str. APS (Acyrthosiphon pisum)]|uniref:NADH-quinone oxidoreductase subunit M n=1 Tax=Buchnera aphidicola subsp. Acyrthosiphon pisum (strain APS) TaxID=107806 RepID=NUOM_BUCAI|nr:NADH-quinone oxidoreductase subunit M [Buchnera aphidicola]P57263.1 RecName: Full=NADH-quinone oxidoreductase subunit M; AltName: Full=NADH dehydrogenase I subunit M; AltName: Full=NDH-1 subunit M [Buchnera aphidicola str. APS (Acyrthosiphon pisum)]pir/C84949/ NADH2 dehydrogenase (ubiquinone) (EC 1.6.5.3) chain M [imported] - Buchnera sp. (strain APS) [Buchnera sp. (in: enterobacteria)]BAB12883.1 NADH dehydrogenase I chain M [Buchnera aphidicola str. APS (Acyrthosiphon pisum)]
MLLSLLIIIPFLSSFFSFFSPRLHNNFPRWIALSGIIATLLVVIQIFFQENYHIFQIRHYPNWNCQLIVPWISRFGIEFNIALDGLSIIMLIFSSFLSIIAIICSWNEIKKNEGFFYFNFMLVFTGIIGVFISCDLFLFFCFWEIMLIPMYFLIALWSDKTEKKKNFLAANKFFLYSQTSGLILLSSILLLVFSHYYSTNILTFNYNLLINKPINIYVEYIVMIGFFLSFAIKMPIVPFHGWLPDIHSRSLSCGSVEIIGVLLKTAPYALLRYNLVLFPDSTKSFSLIAVFWGIISIFYGAWIAFSQTNIKRLIAYSSVSHMGLILIGIYSNNERALQGVVIQMLSNSLTVAALCILSGQIYKRFKTQDMSKMGGLWSCIYWIPGFSLFFSLANLGVPGTGNFIGEFLILSGVFEVFPLVSILATIGIVFSSIYSLNVIQKIFYGPCKQNIKVFFINKQEVWTIIALVFTLVFLGLNPQKIIDVSYNSIHNIQKEFNNSILKIRS